MFLGMPNAWSFPIDKYKSLGSIITETVNMYKIIVHFRQLNSQEIKKVSRV